MRPPKPVASVVSALRRPEFVERSGPQSARDLAHLFHTGARRLLNVGDVAADALRRAPVDPLQGKGDAGQRLTDFVMKLAGDAQALALLGRECAAGAAAALVLDAVEHVVEGARELGHLGDRLREHHAAARIMWVDPPHRPVNRSGGPKTRRSSRTLSAITSSVPPISTSISAAVGAALTRAGLRISTSTAAITTAALIATTRQKSDMPSSVVAGAGFAIREGTHQRAGRTTTGTGERRSCARSNAVASTAGASGSAAGPTIITGQLAWRTTWRATLRQRLPRVPTTISSAS